MGVACVVLASCSEREVVRFDLSATGFDYGFLVLLDAGGVPLRVSDGFGVVDGAVSFGSLPAFELEAGEAAAQFVGVASADLNRAVSAFDPQRAEAITLAVGRPPVAPSIDRGGTIATLAVPATSTVLDVDLDGGGALAAAADHVTLMQLTLTVPLNPDRCSDNQAFTHFGARRDVIPLQVGTATLAGRDRDVNDLIPLSADQVLVLARRAVAIVSRGDQPGAGRYDPVGPSSILTVYDFDQQARQTRAMALEADNDGDGVRRLIVVGDNANGDGAIWDLALSAAGLQMIGTSTIAAATRPERLWDITIDHRGRHIVTGEVGTVLVREPPAVHFAPAPRLPTDKSTRIVMATGVDARPHLAGVDDGRLFEGDLVSGLWEEHPVGGRAESVHLLAIDLTDNAEEVWVAGWKGLLLRRLGRDPWQTIEPAFPVAYEPCTAGGGELPKVIGGDLEGVTLDDEHAYVLSENCNAVLRLRRSDLCSSVVTLADAAVGPPEFEGGALVSDFGSLFIGQDQGGLWVLTP